MRSTRSARPGASAACGLVLSLLALLVAIQSARAHPFPAPDTDYLAPEVARLCTGLNGVLIANPTDCSKFLACCASQASSFVCHPSPTPGYPFYDYSPAAKWGQATYDAASGLCLDQPVLAKCAPVDTQVPAGHYCPDVYASRSHHRRDREAREARGKRAGGVQARRALQATNPATHGAFEFIINNATKKSSTGIVAVHLALIPRTDSVVLAARPISRNPAFNLKNEPGMLGPDGIAELSSLYHTTNGTYVRQHIRDGPFCLGHTHLADGTLLGTGGEDGQVPYPEYSEGRNLIRKYTPATGWRTSANKLRGNHWYPSLVRLPDDRVVISNGYKSEFGGVQDLMEIYDVATDSIVYSTTRHPLAIGYDIYPATYLLPWRPNDNVYLVYAHFCQTGTLYTISTRASINNVAANTRIQPYRNVTYWPWSPNPDGVSPYCGAMSAGGTSALLMLRPEDNYTPTVVQFGGHYFWVGDNNACTCDRPASPYAMRMRLDQGAVASNTTAYVPERMPGRRVGCDAVLLPNGRVIIVNGAAYGRMTGGVDGNSQAHDPVFQAWEYNPYGSLPAGYNHETTVSPRFTRLANSTVIRYYHSVALLLPDASVLVTGSEQGANCYADGCTGTPTPPVPEYRAEKFKPTYFFGTAAARRPTMYMTSVPSSARYGTRITVAFIGNVTGAVLAAPGSVTHQFNQNQRVIKLQTAAGNRTVYNQQTRIITMPPHARITVPGFYMLFLMNGDLPSNRAAWIRLVP